MREYDSEIVMPIIIRRLPGLFAQFPVEPEVERMHMLEVPKLVGKFRQAEAAKVEDPVFCLCLPGNTFESNFLSVKNQSCPIYDMGKQAVKGERGHAACYPARFFRLTPPDNPAPSLHPMKRSIRAKWAGARAPSCC